MALIKCPECGKEISDQAPACIHCGCPLGKTGEAESKNAAGKAASSESTTMQIFQIRPNKVEICCNTCGKIYIYERKWFFQVSEERGVIPNTLIRCPECGTESAPMRKIPFPSRAPDPLDSNPTIPKEPGGESPKEIENADGREKPMEASGDAGKRPSKGKRKKIVFAVLAALLVVAVALLGTFYGRGITDEQAITELFQERGYHVSEVSTERIAVEEGDYRYSQYIPMSVEVTVDELLSVANHDALYKKILYATYGDDRQIYDLVIYDSTGESHSAGYRDRLPKQTFSVTTESESEAPSTQSGSEDSPIWQRTEADVIAAITYDLAGQLIYDGVFSIQKDTTDSGDPIYVIALNGAATSCGFTYLTDTDTGKENLTLLAVDYTSEQNAKAFMIGASAMMLEADTQGSYTSIRDANAAFIELYQSTPENSSTIRKVIGDGEYSIVAVDNTALFSIKEAR